MMSTEYKTKKNGDNTEMQGDSSTPAYEAALQAKKDYDDAYRVLSEAYEAIGPLCVRYDAAKSNFIKALADAREELTSLRFFEFEKN